MVSLVNVIASLSQIPPSRLLPGHRAARRTRREQFPSRSRAALTCRHCRCRDCVVASLAAIGLGTATVASATNSGPPAVAQCNPPEFPTPDADQVTCVVTVVNNVSSSGATSSTVTTTACLAAAGVPFASCPLEFGPVTSTTTSTQLVTSVSQCDGIVYGGGSNTYCNVNVVNNVPVGTRPLGSGRSVRGIGRRRRRRRQHPGLRSEQQYDECHRHPVQRLRLRRGYVRQRDHGGLHRHGWHIGTSRSPSTSATGPATAEAVR